MPRHFRTGPSGAHRWLNCTMSVSLEAEMTDKPSKAAEEGTAAHALCEHKLKAALGRKSEKPVSDFDSQEMEECSDSYASFVLERMAGLKEPMVFVEERIDFSEWVPDGFGTADCLIVAPDHFEVIDFKYGQGVIVDAAENPQMKIYALGALSAYGFLYEPAEVTMSIFQPRRENISTWTISVKDLLDWAENELRPKAAMALAGEGTFAAGDWCRFCKAAVKCRARAEANLAAARTDFKPPLLSDEEVEEILPRLSDITKWADDLSAYALARALDGKSWNGFKVVEGRSVRKYTDEAAVAKAAEEHGYKDIYTHELITLSRMERLMGKKKFNEILGSLVVKPMGKPALVPLSDKRKAIEVNDFKEEQ